MPEYINKFSAVDKLIRLENEFQHHCGWRCSRCKTSLESVVGGYWDNPDEVPKVKFCPNCGVKIV